MVRKEAFQLAVANIAAWGDTDVFPLAPENHVLHDQREEIVKLLLEVDDDFEAALTQHPPRVEMALQLITHEGFRWASQIDPLWNAYLLGAVLGEAEKIESVRSPVQDETVFSHRFDTSPTDSSLFTKDSWARFNQQSAAMARRHTFVVVADIADFYGHIYHHRIENQLQIAGVQHAGITRIMRLLTEFSGGPSYGLPIGGPAARILSELTLSRVDRLLKTKNVPFCRFADDYRLFADSEEQAYSSLITLATLLHMHEGAALHKQKTRVLKSADFLRAPIFVAEDTSNLSAEEKAERQFIRLSLRFDPYDPNAEQDYELLKKELSNFDILEMLSREVAKSRVSVPVVRRLTQALGFVDDDIKQAAVGTLVDNLDMLAPALPVVLRVLDRLSARLPEETRAQVMQELRRRIHEQAYYLSIPLNLAYAFRVLAHENSDANQVLASNVFPSAPPFLQRDLVLHMHNWGDADFISNERRNYSSHHPWVRRSILVSSYILNDEGKFWRNKLELSPFDELVKQWRGRKVGSGRAEVPL